MATRSASVGSLDRTGGCGGIGGRGGRGDLGPKRDVCDSISESELDKARGMAD